MMDRVILTLRILLAALSFAGYSMYLTKRWRVHPLISPAIVISCLGLVMVFSGILNVMPLMVFLLAVSGLALFILTLITNKGIAGLLHPVHLLVVAVLGLLLWKLQGAQVYSVDNFHHWLKVLNIMLAIDELPSYRTPIITFHAYPTGSASYLYYITKLIGFREDLVIITQLMMLVVFSLPLLALPKSGRWLSWMALAGFLAVAHARIYERDSLLVDDLQAFVGIGAIAIAYYYRHDLKMALLCLTPISAYTVLVKNSAFFFIIMTALFLLIAVKDKQPRARLRIVLCALLIPSLVFYLWSRHVHFAYPYSGLGYGLQSKHALNLSSYWAQAKDRGFSQMPALFSRVFGRAFAEPHFPRLLALLSSIAAVLLTLPLWLSGRTKQAIRSLLLLVFAWMGYLLWELGTVGMYAVSMPWDEMEMLATYERYMVTGIVYMFGLMVLSAVVSVNSWDPAPGIPVKVILAALTLACSLVPVLFSGFPGQWGVSIHPIPVRKYFASLKESYHEPFGTGCMFVTDENNNYNRLGKYIQTDFLASNIGIFTTADGRTPKQLTDEVLTYSKDYDFIIVNTQNEELLLGMAEAFEIGALYRLKVFGEEGFIPQ